MATNLPTITNLTGASVTEAGFKTELTNLFASLRERGDPLGMMGAIQNLGLAFSVSGNALTCAVKQRDGSTNADATNVISIPFRSATLASGSFNVRTISAALSLVISSGSTLGHSSATASNTFWYLIDNSGTVELAASSRFFGWSGIVSTTAEGGAGAADSATVMYSTTARSNVPYLCIGKTVDTQTTAGTWAAAPTTVSLAPFDLLDQAASGIVVSVKRQTFTSSGTYTPNTGMLYCDVEVWGGGGGGGGCSAGAAAGGGAGGHAKKVISAATIGASQTVTIGAGGNSGGAAAGTGGTGGTTSFGAILSATGGVGGSGNSGGGNTSVIGGDGGVGSGGDTNITGQPGWNSVYIAFTGGAGGATTRGGNGKATSLPSNTITSWSW